MANLLEEEEEQLLELIKEEILLMSSLLVPLSPIQKEKCELKYCMQREVLEKRADSTRRRDEKVVSWLGVRLVRANAKVGTGCLVLCTGRSSPAACLAEVR